MSHTSTALLTEERHNELRQQGDPKGLALLEHVFELLNAAADKNVKTPEATQLYTAFRDAYSWFKTKAVIAPAKLDTLTLSLINEVERQVYDLTDTTDTVDTTTTVPPVTTAPAAGTTDTTTTEEPATATTVVGDPTNRELLDAINGVGTRVNAVHAEVFDADGNSKVAELDRRVSALENAFPKDSEGRFVHFTEWSNHTVNVAGRDIRWAPAIAAFVITFILLVLFWAPTAFEAGFWFSISQGWKWFWSAVVSIIVLVLTNLNSFRKTAPAA